MIRSLILVCEASSTIDCVADCLVALFPGFPWNSVTVRDGPEGSSLVGFAITDKCIGTNACIDGVTKHNHESKDALLSADCVDTDFRLWVPHSILH